MSRRKKQPCRLAGLLALLLLAGCSAQPAAQNSQPAAAPSVQEKTKQDEASASPGQAKAAPTAVPAPENAAPNWAEGDAVGVAFLGYGTGIAAFADSPEYSAFTARYPLFAGLDPDTQWVETDGEQIFAVWPRYANSSLFLYSLTYEDGAEEAAEGDEPLFAGNLPFLLRCNAIPVQPNTRLTVLLEDADLTVQMEPLFDLQQRSLLINWDGGVCDFTPASEMIQTDCAGFSLTAAGSDVKIYLDPDTIQQNFDCTVDFGPYTVENVSGGVCRGALIGRMGQKEQPVALLWMEDGSVQYLELLPQMTRANGCRFAAEGALPLHDIVRCGQSAAAENGEGGDQTIYAWDAGGQRYDVATALAAAKNE